MSLEENKLWGIHQYPQKVIMIIKQAKSYKYAPSFPYNSELYKNFIPLNFFLPFSISFSQPPHFSKGKIQEAIQVRTWKVCVWGEITHHLPFTIIFIMYDILSKDIQYIVHFLNKLINKSGFVEMVPTSQSTLTFLPCMYSICF